MALIVTESLGQGTGYMEKALDTELSLKACRRAYNRAQWAYEKILELPGAGEAQSFFQEGCPDDRLTLKPPASINTPFYGGGRVVTKVYPYPGYCATVQLNSQKFRVRLWKSSKTLRSSGCGIQVLQNSQKFQAGIQLLCLYPGYCGTGVHNFERFRVRE